nr:hypothetical protein [Actinomadura darangshiensis]
MDETEGVLTGLAAGPGDVVEVGDEARVSSERAGPAEFLGEFAFQRGEQVLARFDTARREFLDAGHEGVLGRAAQDEHPTAPMDDGPDHDLGDPPSAGTAIRSEVAARRSATRSSQRTQDAR